MHSQKLAPVVTFVIWCFLAAGALAQNPGTGAIAGTVLDSSGAVIPGAEITVVNPATGETRSTISGASGMFRVPLLLPGSYDIRVSKAGFKVAKLTGISVAVAEVTVIDITLEVGTVAEEIQVTAEPALVQTESSVLGRVVPEQVVTGLPLVTRNYTQILSLSPGIVTDVTNAGELGRGSGGLSGSTGGIHVNGARSMDNNFQMNGIGINDLMGSGSSSGGVAIPNPDTIQEFKVQTSQYDAAYGRNAGGNVEVVTKSGANEFHGTLFEFYRDRALNANDYFSNRAGQPKPALHQNQFGGTLGGPIKKDKAFFFGSYQGTRQKNGVASECSSSVLLPPLTEDRSAAAIGALFAGQRGLFQNAFGGVGPAVAADGSNINPVALQLLQMRLPNGEYFIPTPQTIDPSQPLSRQGFSVFHDPCTFTEDQGMANFDFLLSEQSRMAVRYFIADSLQTVTFPNGAITNEANQGLPGSPNKTPQRFHVLSLSHTFTLSQRWLNEFRFGYHRTGVFITQENPFTYSLLGSQVSSLYDDLPSIYISGCCQLGGAGNETTKQNSWTVSDSLLHTRGQHNLRFGAGVTRNYIDITDFRFQGTNLYPTWPDFLLGLSGLQNGTGAFSNILVSIDFIGLADRKWRTWDVFSYVQDDWKLFPRLTLNLGLRYEHIGALGDELGRNGNFDPNRADPNPTASGSVAGYIVPSNYTGPIPDGVTQIDNNLGIKGVGQHRWGPRIGFAWQLLPNVSRLVLRGGYGVYYTRHVGQATFQLETAPPFGMLRVCAAVCNRLASAQEPFGPNTPDLSSFPQFTPYTATSNLSIIELAQDYQPPITQQYSLGIQYELVRDLMLEVGYVGTRGTHIIRARGLNQALQASSSDPVRGETTNTFANIRNRLPYLGFSSGEQGIRQLESAGAMWYNGLHASLTKRFSNGLQFLASYTFSRTLDTDGVNPDTLTAGGSNVGDQRNPRARYGPSLFSRDHRFVLSYYYDFPSPRNRQSWLGQVLGGWSISGVTTVQTGQHLTLTGRNTFNVFGITNDRVQLASGCTNDDLATRGSLHSRLNNYFNTACLATNGTGQLVWPVVGDDGIATGFGNSGVGAVTGPGQANMDLAIGKRFILAEGKNLLFRAEMFNAFNHPQFANPGTSADASDFGVITATSVNPRIIQLALKFTF
jgi:outer membrane receptor protein involved in Fe transport